MPAAYQLKSRVLQYTGIFSNFQYLSISVSNLLSKDDVPVYRDMLSVLTPHINFRIPLNFTEKYSKQISFYGIFVCS